MEAQSNPFEAPEAQLEARAVPQQEKIPVYSPGQVAAGSFLGGALVGIYFLYRNFKGMGRDAFAIRTLVGGLISVAVLVAILPFLPPHFPNLAIPLLYTLIARGLANGFQMKKQEILASERYRLVSNWKVAVEALVGLVIFMIVVFAAIFLILHFRGQS